MLCTIPHHSSIPQDTVQNPTHANQLPDEHDLQMEQSTTATNQESNQQQQQEQQQRHVWSIPQASSFAIRGPDYFQTRKKIASQECLFPTRGVDLFLTNEFGYSHVARWVVGFLHEKKLYGIVKCRCPFFLDERVKRMDFVFIHVLTIFLTLFSH